MLNDLLQRYGSIDSFYEGWKTLTTTVVYLTFKAWAMQSGYDVEGIENAIDNIFVGLVFLFQTSKKARAVS